MDKERIQSQEDQADYAQSNSSRSKGKIMARK